MGAATKFLSGVIEGFYGRPWSPDTRVAYPHYLACMGLNTYIYCPKADPCLRRQWQKDWPRQEWEQLKLIGQACANQGVFWGVGLSPYGLYLDYSTAQREALRRRIDTLGALEAPLLAILFDDMPGGTDALAERQAQIVTDISQWLPTVRLLVCPTYYSFDPVLERYFGARPEAYWSELGRLMPAQADIFWTGNEVCSDAISASDIGKISAIIGRPVLLWDNYPVNDSAVRSNFLYTSPLKGRSAELRPLLSGHLCNPMNQALLSLPALGGLARLYTAGNLDDTLLGSWLGEAFWQRFKGDCRLLEDEGLSGLGAERCLELAQVYSTYPGSAAAELTDWLRGKYSFDPACLTD